MRLSLPLRSVRGLTVAVAAVSSLVVILIGGATVYTSHEEIEAQIDHRLELEMDALLDFRRTHSVDEIAALVRARDSVSAGNFGYLKSVDHGQRIMGYALVDPRGHRLAGSLDARTPVDGWMEFLPIRRPDGRRGVAQALTRTLPDGSRIVVAGDRLPLEQSDDRIIVISLLGLGAIVLTGVVATVALGRLVQRRLSAISDTAQGIMDGDWSRRVPLDGSGSEFDRQSQILNQMLDRVEALMRNLRQVSSDIAHDMRTPLTRIRQQMDELLRCNDEADTVDALRRMIVDTEGLIDLFSGLLGVSEIEGFSARRRFCPVRIDAVIEEVAEAYRPAFHDDDRHVELYLRPATVHGDAQLLMRAFANLFENVLAHAGPRAGIFVDMGFADDMVDVRIGDDGIGIASDQEETIFERLARLEPSRGVPGHGLGLAIVRAVALAHRGTAEVDPLGRGLTIRLSIPLAQPASDVTDR